MPNILFLSSDSDFAADLSEQISIYEKDFVILNNDDEGMIDMIILDEYGYLIDGYTTYILAKEMNFEYITILRKW